jgi:hypothetical protein
VQIRGLPRRACSSAAGAGHRCLASYQETFAGISYTNVYTHDDEIVQPNSNDTGSSSLHGGGGQIANIAVQDVCPADSSDHDLLGTVDAVAYALAIDALDHPGPAEKSRIPSSVCTQPYMPGINPVTGPAAGLQAFYDDQSSTGPTTSSEPPLACYVFAACKLQPQMRACRRSHRIRIATWTSDGVRRVKRYRTRGCTARPVR